MAEGEVDVFEHRRLADHRQAVGQRRAQPRPFGDPGGVDAREHPPGVGDQDLGAGAIGGRAGLVEMHGP